ncbi:hypothetical protein [Actinocatenispora comari]|uniref:Uncharacterized protein n=1 Tax=Actinocatenispora comari TaxID=2807577 RepID=A0A8J4EM36_9ACTN|nr:hypothetical protein [Actinocatenispora comari]GIL29947.1 hypothetical protein NUM_52010 [Actinocatenispora comari]
MIRLPFVLVRRTDIDQLYDAGRSSGLLYAETLVESVLGDPARRDDPHALAVLLPELLAALADERAAAERAAGLWSGVSR